MSDKDFSTYYIQKRNPDVFLYQQQRDLGEQYKILFTADAIRFLVSLTEKFDKDFSKLYAARCKRNHQYLSTISPFRAAQLLLTSPNTSYHTKFSDIIKTKWKISIVPERLRDQRLQLGDVSPSNLEHFAAALRADVQGIQVDFDDGHCPSWRNQLIGLYNVYRVVHDQMMGVPPISLAPVLTFRPRPWYMMEHNMSIMGKEVPAALFDFAFIIFHNARILSEHGVGPCLHLSRLENRDEAALWDDIFAWSEEELEIPHGTIKACVLIDNVFSAFSMEPILHALRNHSLGLCCSAWGFAASILRIYGDNHSFLVPGRERYIDTRESYLTNYVKLIVWVCHKRGAQAIGGMINEVVAQRARREVFWHLSRAVCATKLREIQAGIDGFLVYDTKLVPLLNKLWSESIARSVIPRVSFDQTALLFNHPEIFPWVLLKLPKGGVTMPQLRHNITIVILLIFNWLNGRGHFIYDGTVEDSTTADIARSQIWQWIRHKQVLEDRDNECITRGIVYTYGHEILYVLKTEYAPGHKPGLLMNMAFDMFLELVNRREYSDFITSYLDNQFVFRSRYIP